MILIKILELNKNIFLDNITWGEINGPSYCYLEITRKCNCQCQYCQVDNRPNSDIDFDFFKSIIDKLKECNVFEIRLGGGEPLLNSQLFTLLEYIKSKNIFVWICTNGMNLSENICKRLKELDVVGVRVSLDSLNNELHNKMRGNKKSYDLAIKGMKNAKEVGLEVIVAMTIGNHNIAELDDFEKFAQTNGYLLYKHFIMPVGKGKDYLDNNPIVNRDVIVDLLNNDSGEKHCVAVNQSLSIDVDGNISPCTFIKPVINIRSGSIKEIINSSEMQKYAKPVPSGACNKCGLNDTKREEKCIASMICKGGCWALYEENK